MSDSDFRSQQRSFYVNGYARNPSLLTATDATTGESVTPFVGNVHNAYLKGGQTVEELRPSKAIVKATKRKRKEKGTLGVFDPDNPEEGAEVEGQPKAYVGPWAGWEEDKNMEPEPEVEEYEEHAKRSKKGPIIERSKREVGFGEEKSVFHGQRIVYIVLPICSSSAYSQARRCTTTKGEHTCLCRKTRASISNPESLASSNATFRRSAYTPGPVIRKPSLPSNSFLARAILYFRRVWIRESRYVSVILVCSRS